MMLKRYQETVINSIETFFRTLSEKQKTYLSLPDEVKGQIDYLSFAYGKGTGYEQFQDRPKSGKGLLYPRVCLKLPTGGGKTLIAIETIRSYQNLLSKKRTGLVVWITHREQIYRQTIENMQNKSHVYRQLLDQASGNKTLILEKGQPIRQQDVTENLVILMLMIQSAGKETNKIFEDSGGYTDFFPPENRYDLHAELIQQIPNLDKTNADLFAHTQVKSSLGNVIRALNPLIIVDELHTMYTDKAKATLDGLNPSAIVGLSATPKPGMNNLVSVTGRQLNEEGMVKLDLHLIAPQHNADWQSMLAAIKTKRDETEKVARDYEKNTGVYIRPIALIQVERTGKDQRGQYVHSEDVREGLIDLGVPKHEIAVKSSSLDEIREEKLLSKDSEIRYIITKEALKEGWDCSFAYILGIIPNAHTNSGMTQLVGRILRQPYAKKTGIKDLDESYVYFANGQTQEVLNQVQKGFSDEGLSDVMPGVKVEIGKEPATNPTRTVPIKPEFRNNYYHSLFLPMWLIKSGKDYRQLSYETDVKPKLDWSRFGVANWVKSIKDSLTTSQQQVEVLIGIDNAPTSYQTEAAASASLDIHYLTRRITDVVDNAFVANTLAHEFIKQLLLTTEQELLNKNAGYIASILIADLDKSRREQEKAIFEDLVTNDKLKLTVSDQQFGYQMPKSDIVMSQFNARYLRNLYEDVDVSSLNSLEQKVVEILDGNKKVLWWTRNKAGKGWYAIQGWHKGKIRPDFVVAKKTEDGQLEFVYIIESKGEQLMGNIDTEYKKSVLSIMSSLRGKVETVQPQVASYKLNDQFEFELIPQGEEERRIRTKLE